MSFTSKFPASWNDGPPPRKVDIDLSSPGLAVFELEKLLQTGKVILSHADEVWPRLYIGDQRSAANRDDLSRHKVTHILNAAHSKLRGQPDFYEGMRIAYLGIEAHDICTFDMSVNFQAAADFIHRALGKGDLPTSDSKMSLQFSGWEVRKHRRRHRGLRASQWPTDSQVYTMYHGTSVTSARSIITGGFRQSTQGMLGPGVYVSRAMKKAEAYPRGCSSTQRVILEVSVSVGRVKRIGTDNHELQYTWHNKGYDTAWVPPNCGMLSVPSGYEEDCVYDPKNVEVVGIAQAPNALVEEELTRLLAEKQKGSGGSGGTAAACPVCKKPNTHGSQHILEQCWGCRATICVFMDKHFCAVRRK